ncbi:fimbrillin family protein [Parabacteroides sp. AM08-6]|nr:fimbrillin family protein [Parabacteroides sp. AM08-6]
MDNLFLYIILVTSILSCTNENDIGILENFSLEEKPLIIETMVLTTKSPNFIQEFKDGSVIGLHIISENTESLYDSITAYRNVRAEAFLNDDKLKWEQSPKVMLNSEPATVYAYYPYQQQCNFNPENIPVKISADASLTTDYMYGMQTCGQKAINKISPIALLSMNHALALLNFKLRVAPDISTCYLLNAIQIGNKAGGTALCFRETMNIKTGEISGCAGTNASTRLELNSPRMLQAIPGEAQQLMVIPTNRIFKDGDVEILFVINEKTFKFKIPAGTKWEKGYKYIYNLTFDGQNISLDHVSFDEWIPVES